MKGSLIRYYTPTKLTLTKQISFDRNLVGIDGRHAALHHRTEDLELDLLLRRGPNTH